MDDLFAAFDAPVARVHMHSHPHAHAHTDAPKPAAAAVTAAQVVSVPAAVVSAASDAPASAKRPRESTPAVEDAAARKQARADAGHGNAPKYAQHDFGDAIEEASVLELDPAARAQIVDITVSAPEDKPATDTAGAEASTLALRRGSVDESRTTAPDAPASAAASSRPPAKTYPFVLDPFQRRSIECLERDESVLVSAHTSAGKTVVAEYAIAMALRDKQRVVYTSPIKALSNQKYREMFEEFSDVGLLTGDVTINPNASCLVMTTEILRSMLYRGSEITREVKWVIFDEIHYMRDKERGVVWEESIIMLPHKVRFVFLSATIPNAKEFAEWIAKIHHQTCHVVYTDYRPTPLQHFVFPSGADGVYLVVDEKGRFREENFNKAMAALGSSSLEDAVSDVLNKGAGKKNTASKMGKGKAGPGDLFKIVKMIMDRQYDPVIVFSFSKRECEQYALQIAKLDLTSPEEKKLIERVFVNAIESLSEDDKKLPQIDAILPLLKRGIGIHHGGLLPLLKEVIEILFQESLLKILFATETFSMGINMPARTVVFTATRKFDGVDFRWISAGEYIQMSGRAGRRGLDSRGIVIQMLNEKLEPEVAKDILKGTADSLNSAFHLGYNMLLNLMRVEDADPEKMMQQSFHQFQSERALPEMEAELAQLQAACDTIVVPREAEVREYLSLCSEMAGARERLRAFVTAPDVITPFLAAGRLLRVRDGPQDWGWGIIVGYQKGRRTNAAVGSGGNPTSSDELVVDVLLNTAAGAAGSPPIPASGDEPAELRVLPVLLRAVEATSSARLFIPKDLRPKDARDTVQQRLAEVLRRMPAGPPLLDPVADMRISDPDFLQLASNTTALQQRIAASPLHTLPERDSLCEEARKKMTIEAQCAFLAERVKQCKSLVMRDELKKMKRVLRRLGYIDADSVVQPKGRVACEINSADELLCTELIFNGVFNPLDAAQAAAVLSCFVVSEKSGDDDPPSIPEDLAAPLRALQTSARRIAEVAQECKLELDTEEYVKSFRPDMMILVQAWVNGAKFVDVCGMTKHFEGTIIRVIRRLEELTRQLADAAKAIGDEALSKKFEEASSKMRRDIVFAASLYL